MGDNEISPLNGSDSGKPPHIIGDFKIIREIGKGAQGTVYEAEQISLKRNVALKILPAHLSLSDDAVQKFHREAEAGGRQRHPGIVAIYAVGEHEGVHFIAQELVGEGITLGDRLNELRKTGEQPPGYFREVAELVAEAGEALQHAHESGVIHRDIKPSNILLAEEGQPKITDFGLAKIEDALALSRTGDLAGTPYYMSPEQAMSRRIGIDHRTDIYSLGVTLYEMLTLKRPFEGKTSQEILRQIVLIDADEPHKANHRVPRDLSTICMKAMEKMPEKRYQSMKAFSEDLSRFLSGDVILAKPAGLGTRLWKRVKRNPVVSAAISVAFLAVVVFAIVVPWVIARTEKKNYDALLRLSDLKQFDNLDERARELWPAMPGNIAGFESWLEDAGQLIERFPIHQQTLADLREKALPYREEDRKRDRETHPDFGELVRKDKYIETGTRAIAEEEAKKEKLLSEEKKDEKALADIDSLLKKYYERLQLLKSERRQLEARISQRRTWNFETQEMKWWHDMLTDLIRDLEALADEETGLFRDVRKRLLFASTIEKRSLDDHRAAWDQAIASIADESQCPQYEGLRLEPKIGFVPIGRDPVSGLWEFVHLQTGEIPERDADGKLILTEEAGLCFVLLPGGVFNMGAELPSEEQPFGTPNVDHMTEPNEQPVHEVTIRAFLLSKYEMTQAQWLRFTGENPSFFDSEHASEWFEFSWFNPVERVNWQDCWERCNQMNLRLPSESEWEFAARAGTRTVWWTGDEKESLDKAVNLCDRTCKKHGDFSSWPHQLWIDDGYVAHAPVGSFKPNAFGLHDMMGNVWEWCQDYYGSGYRNTPRDGSPQERAAMDRVKRGGGWRSDHMSCRSANRSNASPDNREQTLGLRPACSL
ncbi:MAG: SUMF1/EgtB/PvdO family nonheme iron enzyme [Planctomycetota bacterium]|jgi:formylglycine-generating enzyme required for sulfatase activity